MKGRTGAILAARLAVAALLLAASPALAPHLAPFLEWVARLGPWAPAAFVGGYAVATVCLVPGSLLTMAAGLIFGLVRGSLLAFAGASLGAAAAFLVARHLARGAALRWLAERPAFARIDRAVGEEGLKIAVLLRLVPLVPFVWLNYALGLTRLRFRDYLLASFAMLPGAFLYAYYGRVLGSLAALAGGVGAERGAAGWILLAVGLAAAIAVGAALARIAGQALRAAPGMEEGAPAATPTGEDDG